MTKRTNRVGGPSEHTPSQIQAAIEAYTPRLMSAVRWSIAGPAVRDAATRADFNDLNSCKAHLSTLVAFLESPCGWDGQTEPDLTTLLNEHSIRTLAKGSSAQAQYTCRNRLRKMARAVGAMTALAPRPDALAPRESTLDGAEVEAFDVAPVPAVERAWRATDRAGSFGAALRDVARAHGVALAAQATAGGDGEPTCDPRHGLDVQLAGQLSELAVRWGVVDLPAASPSASAPRKRPTSRRAIMREAAEAAARAQQIASSSSPRTTVDSDAHAATPTGPLADSGLPEDIVQAVQQFKPIKYAEAWRAHQSTAELLVAAYRPTSVRNARNICSQIATFVDWLATWPGRGTTGTLAKDDLLRHGLIEAFLADSDLAKQSAQSIRSTLRRSLGSLEPTLVSAKIPHRPPAAPYSESELHDIRFLVENQPYESKRCALGFIVGLSAGAGCDAGDMRTLRRSSFHQIDIAPGQTVLAADISNGRRSRTVIINNAFAPMVRESLRLHALCGKGEEDLIVGEVEDRINILPQKRRHIDDADGGRVVQVARLRNSWLVAALQELPLPLLMRASGLHSSRAFGDLLAYCAAPTEDLVRRAAHALTSHSTAIEATS